jgi:gluconate 5-dehydrogenase
METQIKFNVNYTNLFMMLFMAIIGYLYYNNYLHKEREHFQIKKLKQFKNHIQSFNKRRKKLIDPDYEKKEKEKELKKYSPIYPKELNDSKVLITGSTRGLGFEIAKEINKYRPILVVTGKTQKNVDKVVKELKKKNHNVYGFAIDLSQKDGAKKLFDIVYKKVGAIDILINNAFTAKGSRFLVSKNHDDWTDEFFVNVNSSILLSQKFAYRMKMYKKKGRIINVSSYSSKLNSTYTNSGSEILLKNMLEKFTNMMAEELYRDKIAVTTLRVDEYLNTGYISFLQDTLDQNESMSNYFGEIVGTSPKKVVPVVMYAVKAPFHEISGKVISTKAFYENSKLSKIVPSHNLKLNKDIFKKVVYTKTIKRDEKDKTYLMKQNPFPSSPRVKKHIKKNKDVFNKFNTLAKYDSILDNVIAKKLNIEENNIVFFKTEYDAIKKLIEILVPKYQEIVTINPSWETLKLVTYENKIEMKYAMMDIKKDKFFVPNYKALLDLINTKTKMIYLSSPNTVSGQNIVDDTDFKNFIKSVPDNIPILIDQRYIEFCSNIDKHTLNPLKYLKRENIIILRTFNNFYSIENLELTYIITNKDLAELIKDSQVINHIDKFNEELALKVYNDKYYDKVRKDIKRERERVFGILQENEIRFLESDTNYFLIETKETRDIVQDQLEKRGLILYSSYDGHDNYWTLPIGDKETNTVLLDTILYKNV